MATYSERARSNYFKVKDDNAFIIEMDKYEVDIIKKPEGMFCAISRSENGFPSSIYDEDTEQDKDIEFNQILSEHLADGEVCVLMGVGSEKNRYLVGWAMAFNNTGKTVNIGLDEIYHRASEEFGSTPTYAVH